MKKIIKHPTLPGFVFVLFLFMCEKTISQTKEFSGKIITTQYPNLNRYLKKFSVCTLDLNDISTYARKYSQKTRFNLRLPMGDFKLEVELNDMRGKDYKAVAMTDKGGRELNQALTNTYKGFENNDRSNIVRLNMDDSTFEGYIKKGNKWLYFDKLNRYVKNERNDKIVVYDGDDVIPDPTKKCGAKTLEAEKKKFESKITYENFALTGNCRFLEIATEADYEYYQTFSYNDYAALSEINKILNLVEGLYTPYFNVKFILRYQQIWVTPNDPYSGTTLQEILPQFTDWWNANAASISRDVTQMYTGRALTNSAVGYAWIGTVCNNSWYYSVVVKDIPLVNSTVALSAHELGHNFGADHDSTCNGGNIMCSYSQDGAPQWSSQSLTQISNYITGNGSCMIESFPTDRTYFGTGRSINYLKLIASNSININSSSGEVRLSTTGFGYIEAGSGIVLAPTNPNSLGFLAPQGSVLLMRISDVLNTCDPLFVNHSSLVSKIQYKSDLNKSTNDVLVRPNPFVSTFELTINSNEDKKVVVIVYNSFGIKAEEQRRINLSKGVNKVSLNYPNLAPGVYMLEINFSASKIVKKIIKQ